MKKLLWLFILFPGLARADSKLTALTSSTASLTDALYIVPATSGASRQTTVDQVLKAGTTYFSGGGGASVNVSPHSVLFSTGGTTISGNTGMQYDDLVSSESLKGSFGTNGEISITTSATTNIENHKQAYSFSSGGGGITSVVREYSLVNPFSVGRGLYMLGVSSFSIEGSTVYPKTRIEMYPNLSPNGDIFTYVDNVLVREEQAGGIFYYSTTTYFSDLQDSTQSPGSNNQVLTSLGGGGLGTRWKTPSSTNIDVSTGGFVVAASTSVNFIAGTNTTITATNSGGRTNLTFNSTGGGGSGNFVVPSTFPVTYAGPPYPLRSQSISAAAGFPQFTNGCVPPQQFQTSVSSNNYIGDVFQAGTTQYWQTDFMLPGNYVAGSTFTVKVVMTSTAQVTATWNIDASCIASGGSEDASWGSAVQFSTGSATNTLVVSQESGAIMPAGSCAPNQEVNFRLYRNSEAVDAYFRYLTVYYEFKSDSAQ